MISRCKVFGVNIDIIFHLFSIFVSHIYLSHLFPILVSHTYFPLGSLDRMNFYLFPTYFPYLSPILVSHTCLPLWVPWGAWGKAGNKYKEKFRNNILYRKPKNNFDFLHLFGINVGIIFIYKIILIIIYFIYIK